MEKQDNLCGEMLPYFMSVYASSLSSFQCYQQQAT